jgi:shikimate kinase
LLPPFFYTGPVSKTPVTRTKARPIYLIGPMGVGKSTIGPLLASRLARNFIDTDRELETRQGRTISEIFAEAGEAAFRSIEAETIDAVSSDDAVIALGGGAVTPAGAIEKLLDRGDLVYLEASAEVVVERIGDASSRPLLAGLDLAARVQRLNELLEERRPLYERATHRVDAMGEPSEVVERILAALGADV